MRSSSLKLAQTELIPSVVVRFPILFPERIAKEPDLTYPSLLLPRQRLLSVEELISARAQQQDEIA